MHIDDFTRVMSSFRQLDTITKHTIRNIAAHELIARGAEEIGSSDTNHAIYQLYKAHGSWSDLIANNILEN